MQNKDKYIVLIDDTTYPDMKMLYIIKQSESQFPFLNSIVHIAIHQKNDGTINDAIKLGAKIIVNKLNAKL